MSLKKIIAFIFGVALVLVLFFVFFNKNIGPKSSPTSSTKSASVRFISSTITADGVVTAQNQATLSFQIGGKLVYLPFKEGDKILAGQTIASLDSYTIREQLKTALNNYRVTRNSFDQTKENIGDNVAEAQQVIPYNYYSSAGLGGTSKNDMINNAVARIADNSQASLDNSVVSVELANYSLQLASLVSPLSGIVTHQGATVSGINITPATTFTVADPDSMVFRANVPSVNIYYISEGSEVTIAIDGIQNKISGTVLKIYPSKVTLSTGQSVYQVDIVSDSLKKMAKLDQSGRATISTNAKDVALVPAWTVLSGKYIWIDNNGRPELRIVKVGKTHGYEVEVISGLSKEDKIIINPQYIKTLKY